MKAIQKRSLQQNAYFALRSKIQIHTMSVVKVPKKANTAQWTGLMKSKSNRCYQGMEKLRKQCACTQNSIQSEVNAVLRIYNTYYTDIWKSTRLNKQHRESRCNRGQYTGSTPGQAAPPKSEDFTSPHTYTDTHTEHGTCRTWASRFGTCKHCETWGLLLTFTEHGTC